MPLEELPDWLPAWCLDQLGAEPVSVLFQARQVSMVFGLRLAGGTVAYQDIRGRLCTAAEQEVAWAAGVWMAAYNAREEALYGHTLIGRDALRAQAPERLRRANA
jgi:hypothetical protein